MAESVNDQIARICNEIAKAIPKTVWTRKDDALPFLEFHGAADGWQFLLLSDGIDWVGTAAKDYDVIKLPPALLKLAVAHAEEHIA